MLTHTVLCISHLRWNSVFQRPQHLLSRAAAHALVLFFEEPVEAFTGAPWLETQETETGVRLLIPHLPPGGSEEERERSQRTLLDAYLQEIDVRDLVLWYYSPMSFPFTNHLDARVTVYDCMDELSAFRHAPPRLLDMEERVIAAADVVFTGGQSLYNAKRHRHENIHLFPSSVDVEHFKKARAALPDPADQSAIRTPRLGFFGVIDERFDTQLLAELARARPDWQFVIIGPVVKISQDDLPRGDNIHYLGKKEYAELPGYIAHWDAAIMPFAMNESTRFISPTKTPEFLAAGCPVVSTPIVDVVSRYGDTGVVKIAANAAEFETAIESVLLLKKDKAALLKRVDDVLAGMSWDRTWNEMQMEIEKCIPRTQTV
ncbi:MAG: glycosyltransferase family 1 protein [Janthinobacterium lividum]